jgi:hypothetical protein
VKLLAGQSAGASKIYGTDTTATDARMQVIRYKSFGIGAGTIVTSDTLATDVTISAVGPTYQDTGLEITIDTVEDEQVHLVATGIGRPTGATTFGMLTRMEIDGTTYSPILYNRNDAGTARRGTFTNSWVTPPLTSGSHTIKLQAATAGQDWYLSGANWVTGVIPTLQAIQHRGGLIPVQDDGVDIVDKPSALNFAGAGVAVTQSGSKALITIPGGGTDFTDDTFRIQDNGDNTKEIAFEASNITTSTVRTVSMPDKDIDLSDVNTPEFTRQIASTSTNTDGSTIVGCTTAGITITLRTADAILGKIITIKDESGGAAASNIIIDTEVAQTIDGQASLSITVNYGAMRLYSDGTNWFSI